ncbi:hypothetical protein T12_5458 [Trichinella patagoniensis]|uniref:Uncharacterized protein n=1 Tax=Trichinella patagoniensis TaxID=990121 RepID=A0A0V0Z9X0_9BILA|nr:hypothetical protein T12_5458 [Trichinella patagoniensis]
MTSPSKIHAIMGVSVSFAERSTLRILRSEKQYARRMALQNEPAPQTLNQQLASRHVIANDLQIRNYKCEEVH